MNRIIRKDIIAILDKAVSIINQGRFFELRYLSDHIIHNASIFQDEDSILVAVIIYALSKVYYDGKKMNEQVISRLKNAKAFVEKNQYDVFRKEMKNLFSLISEKDEEKKAYFNEVIRRAQIKKGSKIFDHGISLAQVASRLGISRWELMNYIGKTTITDSFEDISDVADKLEFTRSLFVK